MDESLSLQIGFGAWIVCQSLFFSSIVISSNGESHSETDGKKKKYWCSSRFPVISMFYFDLGPLFQKDRQLTCRIRHNIAVNQIYFIFYIYPGILLSLSLSMENGTISLLAWFKKERNLLLKLVPLDSGAICFSLFYHFCLCCGRRSKNDIFGCHTIPWWSLRWWWFKDVKLGSHYPVVWRNKGRTDHGDISEHDTKKLEGDDGRLTWTEK